MAGTIRTKAISGNASGATRQVRHCEHMTQKEAAQDG
jgi:hypothetical protein